MVEPTGMIERSPPTSVAMLLAWVFFCVLVCFVFGLGGLFLLAILGVFS
jgi:hypothetical protein